jgi:hypothetical protein
LFGIRQRHEGLEALTDDVDVGQLLLGGQDVPCREETGAEARLGLVRPFLSSPDCQPCVQVGMELFLSLEGIDDDEDGSAGELSGEGGDDTGCRGGRNARPRHDVSGPEALDKWLPARDGAYGVEDVGA